MSLGEVEVYFEESTASLLKPGDVNGDGSLNIADSVAQLGFLFSSEAILACYVVPRSVPPELTGAGLAMLDFNGDAQSNIADPVASLGFLFGGGPPHALGAACVEVEGDCAPACGQ
jgi:hypothetical protein